MSNPWLYAADTNEDRPCLFPMTQGILITWESQFHPVPNTCWSVTTAEDLMALTLFCGWVKAQWWMGFGSLFFKCYYGQTIQPIGLKKKCQETIRNYEWLQIVATFQDIFLWPNCEPLNLPILDNAIVVAHRLEVYPKMSSDSDSAETRIQKT